MIALFLACTGVVPTDRPADPGTAFAGLQLTSDFTTRFTKGYACTDLTLVGPVEGHGVFHDATGELAMSLLLPDADVFLGAGLDDYLDADSCDDLGGAADTSRTGMRYRLTQGTIDVHQDDASRTFRLVDAVFSPTDDLHSLDTGFGDVTGLQPVEIGTVTLPPLPLGRTAQPLP